MYNVINIFIHQVTVETTKADETEKESRAIAKMTARCALYTCRCPEKFRESLTTPMATFPEIVAIDRIKVRTYFEIRSFTRS